MAENKSEDGGVKMEEPEEGGGKKTEDGGERTEEEEERPRSEDGGFTSGPGDGVKRRRSQVKGQKPRGKGQNRGEEWKADDGGMQAERRRRRRVWPARAAAGGPDLALHQRRTKDGGWKMEE
jgi:hypothetical protein